jgi:hypothetical protein
MLNPQPENVTQAVQEATREGAEQAGRIAQISTDVSEREPRAPERKFSSAMWKPFRKRCTRSPRLPHV